MRLFRSRRIRVLQLLVEAETSVTIEDLAIEIARSERDRERTVTESQVVKTYLSLYHRHIPKLVDAGLVSYDPDAERVVLSDLDPIQQLELRC